MKRNLFQNVKWRHLVLITVAVGVQACSKEETPLLSSTINTQPVAMRLSYELEAITHREILSARQNTNLTFLDEIASEPVVDRQAVDILVFEDGSADYLIEKRTPERMSLPSWFEGVPPNDMPPINKTKITKGIAYFYDAQDNLIYQHPMEEDYAMGEQMKRLTGQYDWETEAKAAGAEVKSLSEGIIRIRRAVPDEGITEGSALRTAAGRYTEEVVMPGLNLVLGNSMHEADGTLISRTMNKYSQREDKGAWVPEQMYYEEHGIDEVTGSAYVSRTTYYYDNYSLQTN